MPLLLSYNNIKSYSIIIRWYYVYDSNAYKCLFSPSFALISFLGKVIVTALPAVDTTGKTYDDVVALSDSVRDSMVEVYERSSAELNNTKLSWILGFYFIAHSFAKTLEVFSPFTAFVPLGFPNSLEWFHNVWIALSRHVIFLYSSLATKFSYWFITFSEQMKTHTMTRCLPLW